MTRQTLAFGVEPGFLPYQLKQARYQAMAESISEFAGTHSRGRRLELLDVGVGVGNCRRYSELFPNTRGIHFHGADLFTDGGADVYKANTWELYKLDLEDGLPIFGSNRFDIVVCEQVFEHLHNLDLIADEIVRVLKPGGLLIVGVPIFLHGVHLLRRWLVSLLEMSPWAKKNRGHVQGFSLRSFLDLLRRSGPLQIQDVRGFRIVSGGLLRPLENFRWWWELNRFIGSKAPFLCIEAQVVATKMAASLELNEPILLPLHGKYEHKVKTEAAPEWSHYRKAG